MTTKIHVVNFGPEPVESVPSLLYGRPSVRLYAQQSVDFYVFDGQDVTIREVRQTPEAPPTAQS